jgi:hypothetical protein
MIAYKHQQDLDDKHLEKYANELALDLDTPVIFQLTDNVDNGKIVATIAAIITIVGLIANPIIGVTLNDSSSITPTELASLLENENILDTTNCDRQFCLIQKE